MSSSLWRCRKNHHPIGGVRRALRFGTPTPSEGQVCEFCGSELEQVALGGWPPELYGTVVWPPSTPENVEEPSVTTDVGYVHVKVVHGGDCVPDCPHPDHCTPENVDTPGGQQ